MESYRQPGDSDRDVLARYLWNLALCEASYPALQNLEVTLRNTIHAAISTKYKTEFWMLADEPLSDRDYEDVEHSRDAIAQRLPQGREPTAGQIVAELDFGFWTSLLSPYYGYQPKTRQELLWPKLLKPAFPYMTPPAFRSRENLAGRLNHIRKFRNRVFHHEAVWKSSLAHEYAQILEAIGWISPDLQRLTIQISRFPEVLSAGIEPHCLKIDILIRD